MPEGLMIVSDSFSTFVTEACQEMGVDEKEAYYSLEKRIIDRNLPTSILSAYIGFKKADGKKITFEGETFMGRRFILSSLPALKNLLFSKCRFLYFGEEKVIAQRRAPFIDPEETILDHLLRISADKSPRLKFAILDGEHIILNFGWISVVHRITCNYLDNDPVWDTLPKRTQFNFFTNSEDSWFYPEVDKSMAPKYKYWSGVIASFRPPPSERRNPQPPEGRNPPPPPPEEVPLPEEEKEEEEEEEVFGTKPKTCENLLRDTNFFDCRKIILDEGDSILAGSELRDLHLSSGGEWKLYVAEKEEIYQNRKKVRMVYVLMKEENPPEDDAIFTYAHYIQDFGVDTDDMRGMVFLKRNKVLSLSRGKYFHSTKFVPTKGFKVLKTSDVAYVDDDSPIGVWSSNYKMSVESMNVWQHQHVFIFVSTDFL